MKRKGLLKRALSCVLSATLACSGATLVPQTANAAVSNWKKNIYIDFGTKNSNVISISDAITYKYFGEQLSGVEEIRGSGDMLYDTNDLSSDSSGQNVGFNKAVPAGFTGKTEQGGNYFQDWVYGVNGEPYTFKADLPAGQYVVYLYTGNKTANSAANSGNVTKAYFGEESSAIYDQSSVGGSQFYGSANSYDTWQENEAAYEVTVKDSGDGTGTLSVTLYDDTVTDSDSGKISKLSDTSFYNLVDYDGYKAAKNAGEESYLNVQQIDENGVNLTGTVISARLNGIEIASLSDAVATTKVTSTEKLSVEAGKTTNITAEIEPAGSTERVYYVSENPDIAKVNTRTGEVTGVAPGTTKIITVSGDYKDETEVTVSRSYASSIDKTASTVSIQSSEAGDTCGTEEVTLTFEAESADSAKTAFTAEAKDPSVVEVKAGEVTAVQGKEDTYEQKYTITAKAKGSCDVVFTRNTGTTLTYKATVVKTAYGIVWDETVNKDGIIMDLNDTETVTLTAKVLPEDASNTNVTYSSSDKAIVTVGAATGKLTAKGAGKATITATSKDGGFTAEVGVTVIKTATGLTLDAPTKTLTVGETAGLKATLTEEDVTDTLKWASDNEKVATVDQTGKITAVAAGTANITVTTVTPIAGKEKTAKCVVTVKAKEQTVTPVTNPDTDKKTTKKKASMTISGKTTVKKGKTITLKAKTKNTTKKVTWKIKDAKSKKIIKITKKNASKKTAVIKGLKKGTGKLTVTCGTLKKTVKIKVTKK